MFRGNEGVEKGDVIVVSVSKNSLNFRAWADRQRGGTVGDSNRPAMTGINKADSEVGPEYDYANQENC